MESTFSPEQNQPRNNSAANSNTAGETTKVTSSSINPTASYVDTYETAITAASQWWSCPGAMANNVKNVPLPDKAFARGEKPEGKVTDARPKGTMSAYAFFVQTFHDENKKEPDETLAEYSKKCSKRWNAMSEKEKKKFHEMAEQV